MSLPLHSVYEDAFRPYGQVLKGYDWSPLLDTLRAASPKPEEGVVYVPSVAALEALPVFGQLTNAYYGGLPIQIGYCNGHNTLLNCLEYHRDSEVDVAADDAILLVGLQGDIREGQYDTSKVMAFLCPAGTGVELFATTLHYAPCQADAEGFRMIIVLPRGTNTDAPSIVPQNEEDKLLRARNKWLLAHPEAPEAGEGAHIGLVGVNLDVSK